MPCLSTLRASARPPARLVHAVGSRHHHQQSRRVFGGNGYGLLRVSGSPLSTPPVSFALRAATSDAPSESGTFEYQAETSRLMDLIVNSLYSNKDIFLRELVSNASDALDKMRFYSVTDASALGDTPDLEIKIKADPENRTLTITDTGIGMSREQLQENLGTIARSGTAKFSEMLKEQQASGEDSSNLIGRFGVGFYSSFLVADRVTVRTKSNDDGTQWKWESEVGSTSFTINADESDEKLGRGTQITLHLKEDAAVYAEATKLGELLKTYSEFISFPIKLWSSKTEPMSIVDDEETKKAKDDALAELIKEREEKKAKGEEVPDDLPSLDDVDVQDVMKTEYETKWDYAVQNQNQPIWTRSKSDVTKEEYNQFFKTTFREFLDPLAHNHFSVEGTIEFKGLIYVPGMAPFDQQDAMGGNRLKNIKLFVRRVFISDEFDSDLVPRYLNFIKGVVDSNDLPLNVSREILQESRIVRVIRKQLVRKTLDMLKEIAGRESSDDYATFWESFGKNIKLGVIEDSDNRDDLAQLLRFPSSKSDGGALRSLSEYVADMKEGQKAIYYLAADSTEAAKKMPFLEKLVKDGYEVLYLTEPIDEVAVTNLVKFDEKDLVDVSKEDLGLETSEEEKAKEEETAKEFKPFTDWLAEVYGAKVEKVVVSNRLADTPCVLVTSKFGWSANMERIMKAQAMGDARAMEYMRGKRIMEINPESAVMQQLKQKFEQNKDDEVARRMADVCFDTALLTSGFDLEDPMEFATNVYKLMGEDGGSAPSSEAVEPEVV